MKQLKLSSYLYKYRVFYIIAITASTLSIALDMLFPQVVKHIVDDVLITRKMEVLTPLLLGILFIGIGRFVFRYIREYLCDFAGSKIAGEIRISLFRKIQSLSANFFDGINSGELMSRVKDDVDRVWDIFTYVGILTAEVVIHTALALYFMFTLNWKLTIIPLCSICIAAIVDIFMERKLDKIYGSIAQKNSELNNTAQENLSGMRTVKAFVREPFEIKKFREQNNHYYELNIQLSNIFVKYNPILQCISYIMPCLVLLTGGLFAMQDKLTVGTLTAFIQYSMNIVWPMEMLGWLTNCISSARASTKRINKIFAEEADITNVNITKDTDLSTTNEQAKSFVGDITFDNVSYKTKSGKAILSNVSFNLPHGKTLGIMGATGSGKTTIINLLKRMYDVSEGSIKVDGKDIRSIELAELRRNIACVMQDVFLFSDTIDGNVKLGDRNILEKESIDKAFDESCSTEFITNLKEGVNTVIGERGIGLSGGQKQRLTIARALSRNKPVLILDDSTSALDTETELQIQNTLAQLTGLTKIIITHRISGVRNADEIIVLENGTIAERGTHDSLLEQKGLYYTTYKSQY